MCTRIFDRDSDKLFLRKSLKYELFWVFIFKKFVQTWADVINAHWIYTCYVCKNQFRPLGAICQRNVKTWNTPTQSNILLLCVRDMLNPQLRLKWIKNNTPESHLKLFHPGIILFGAFTKKPTILPNEDVKTTGNLHLVIKTCRFFCPCSLAEYTSTFSEWPTRNTCCK
jgi:hypothetical protein